MAKVFTSKFDIPCSIFCGFIDQKWPNLEPSPTIRRLVDDITLSYSVPIEEEKIGKQLHFRIPSLPKPPLIPLSSGELAVLKMCRAFTRHLLGKKQFEAAASGLTKSRGLLSPEQITPPGRIFGCLLPGSIDYTRHQEVLAALVEAVVKHRICRVAYHSLASDVPMTFCIMPLKIFSHLDTIYVHSRRTNSAGHPKDEDAFDPLLAIHRLKHVEILEASYEVPGDYDFEGAFNRTFGVIKEKTFLRVKLGLTGWAARFASERIWSPDQTITEKKDGSIELVFSASSKAEVLSWVMFLGPEAKLLYPPRLRKLLVKTLGRMQENYPAGKSSDAKTRRDQEASCTIAGSAGHRVARRW